MDVDRAPDARDEDLGGEVVIVVDLPDVGDQLHARVADIVVTADERRHEGRAFAPRVGGHIETLLAVEQRGGDAAEVVAQALRARGVPTEVAASPQRFGKQMQDMAPKQKKLLIGYSDVTALLARQRQPVERQADAPADLEVDQGEHDRQAGTAGDPTCSAT